MHLLNRIKCRGSSPYWLEYGNFGQNNAIQTEKWCKAVHLAHNYIPLYFTQSCKNYKPYIAKTVSEIVSYWKYPSMPQILHIFWQHVHLTHWDLGKMSIILKPHGHWYFNVKIKYFTYPLKFHLDAFLSLLDDKSLFQEMAWQPCSIKSLPETMTYFTDTCASTGLNHLTRLPLNKMAATFQTIFSDAFLWIKSFVFWLKIHWSLFLGVQLTIAQHWFR